MRILIICLFIFTNTICFSQKKEVKDFMFGDTQINYSKIDYSKYGVGLIFITIYNKRPQNEVIEKKSIRCLRNKKRLYHTQYFFLEIPNSITNKKQKTDLFANFLEHLKQNENIDKYKLYLNFDIDYSSPNQLSEYDVKRIISNITPNNICKTL